MSQPKIGSLIKWINGHNGEEHIGFIDSVIADKGLTDYGITWLTERTSNQIRPVFVGEYSYGHTWFIFVEG